MRLKHYRKCYNLSQSEFARIMGVKQTTISAWECGAREPNILALKKMAEIFRCTVDELLRDGGEEGDEGGTVLHG